MQAGIHSFAINTHHYAEAWRKPRADWQFEPNHQTSEQTPLHHRARWRDCSVDFFHEPELLETGGGLRHIQPWIGHEDILVHNGDIYTSLPLEQLMKAHQQNDHPVTLALRTGGPAQQIGYQDGRVIDIRNMLKRAPGTHTFTGVYCVSPSFLDLIPPHQIISVIPAFLKLAESNRLGALVLDDGAWFDLGDIPSYLDAHQQLQLADPIHSQADIAADAVVKNSVIGPGATISNGAHVTDSVVWPDAVVEPGCTLDHAVRI